jgi:lysozyme
MGFVFQLMHMTLRGRQRLTDREGKRLKAYRDTQGIWTIGVGHAATSGRAPIPKRGMVITPEQCDEILLRDLAERYEPLLNKALAASKSPTADHEFDALLSIVFNVESFAKSTAIRLHCAGDKAGCAAHILDWRKPPEIIGRRHTEQSQYLTPYTLGK